MARHTPLRFYRGVLIDEWALFFGVTLETDGILCCRRTKLSFQKSSMRIMAIVALNQPFVHSMMKGPIKLVFDFEVTAITELGLFITKKVFGDLGVMRRMALNAANVILHVGCTREIVMLCIESVTS